MIEAYLKKRRNLLNVFFLIDSRIPPQKIDIDIINWFGEEGIPFTMVFTKSDKINQLSVKSQVQAFEHRLGDYWESLPEKIITSAKSGTGIAEIISKITETNRIFYERNQ